MNIKRIISWSVFIILLGLIIWGLIVAENRKPQAGVIPEVSSTDHIKGNPEALVTIVEYSDFECPACQTYYWFVDKLIQEASSSIKLVYRHLPLPQHKHAIPMAIASEAAGKQGKFWEMYDQIFRNANEWVPLTDSSEVIEKYATNIGLDLVKFRSDIVDPAVKEMVMDDLRGGQNALVNSTPSFFINGKLIENQASYANFKAIIDEAIRESSI
jgi:protein-disulfide isomerase